MLERLKRDVEQGERGFTLIELLVVIVILGILAAVVVFAVGGIGDKGNTSACKIDTRTLRTAEEAYSAQPTAGNGSYTADENVLKSKGFLSEVSTYHDVVLDAGPPAGFHMTVSADGRCGTAGATTGTANAGRSSGTND